MPKNLSLIELTLQSIKACCDSLDSHIRDIGNGDAATLDRLYNEILEVQTRVVLRQPSSTPEAPQARTAEDERRDTLAYLRTRADRLVASSPGCSGSDARALNTRADALRLAADGLQRGEHEGAADSSSLPRASAC